MRYQIKESLKTPKRTSILWAVLDSVDHASISSLLFANLHASEGIFKVTDRTNKFWMRTLPQLKRCCQLIIPEMHPPFPRAQLMASQLSKQVEQLVGLQSLSHFNKVGQLVSLRVGISAGKLPTMQGPGHSMLHAWSARPDDPCWLQLCLHASEAAMLVQCTPAVLPLLCNQHAQQCPNCMPGQPSWLPNELPLQHFYESLLPCGKLKPLNHTMLLTHTCHYTYKQHPRIHEIIHSIIIWHHYEIMSCTYYAP